MIRIAAVAVLALTLAASAARAAPGTVSLPAGAERDLTIRNGDVELRGTLLMPSGTGPFPAVVFLPGSGPHVRAGFKPYADEFAKLGVASLFYDKRGSGESKGSWVTSSLDDLANDAVAAVTLLKGMKEIDSTRIGFWGVSQGGWVAPLAASKMGNAAFLIVVSGGGVTPRESEMFAYRQHFKRMGLSPTDTTKAVAILDEYFRYLATGKDREKVAARLVEIQKGTLAPLAEHLGGILPSQENQRNWAWVATYDPASYISALRCPVLLLFGDHDTEQPADLAAARWRESLAKGSNEDVTVVTFPGADHGIRIRGLTPDAHDSGGHGAARAPFADGYMDVQVGWLSRHVASRVPKQP